MLSLRALFVLLLCAGPAHASEIKLATWSMSWLTERASGDPGLPADVVPKRPEDLELLASYARALDADVVALQEVDGPEVTAKLFPPDRYDIVMTRDDLALRVGFAIRRGLAYTVNPDLTALDLYPRARFRLRSGADISIATPSGTLRVLAVHLKAGCRDDSLTDGKRRQCQTLGGQLAALEGWIALRQAEGAPFVIAGDFNRHMDGADPFLAGLQQGGPLTRATEGRSNPCWGGSPFIDHILAGGAARAWIEPETTRVLVYHETAPEFRARLSDHCPVSVRLRLPE